jgi:beta-lactamase superfamily II metal-dependent hydrolase
VKLKVFFASDGDCLLLTSGDGHHVLIDGGRTGSFEKQTRPLLLDMAASKTAIDLVVVSHIDADHISGVISLLEDVAAWAVHDFQVNEGQNATFPEPKRPRPPEIGGLWHNSWRAQLGDLAGPIDALAVNVSEAMELASPSAATGSDAAGRALESVAELAESISDGIKLMRLVEDQTPISRNASFGTKLVRLRRPVHTEQIGTTTLTVLGPSEKHLRRLRDEWRDWLERQLHSAQPGSRGGDGEGLGNLELQLAGSVPTSVDEARTVIASIATAAEIIEKTNSARVTPPNRASITLLAEENGRTCLLTGDAAEEELLEGLSAAGCFANGPFHCNVVKVQHHGSEFNLSKVFASKVVAEHYVFCADGAHGNPNPSVVKTIIESRLEAEGPFTIWFNCSEQRTIPKRREDLGAAIREAREAASRHTDRITVKVLDDDQPFFEIEI